MLRFAHALSERSDFFAGPDGGGAFVHDGFDWRVVAVIRSRCGKDFHNDAVVVEDDYEPDGTVAWGRAAGS